MDDKVRESAQTALIRARIKLMRTHPFYAHLVMKMPLAWMENVPGGLSCTDGESMFIAAEAFLKLSKEEQITVLVHETLHCAAGHLFRRGGRDPFKWNVAGDVYIANVISSEGFTPVTLPAETEAYFEKVRKACPNHMELTTDAIYPHVPDPPKQKGGKGQGTGSSGGNGNESHPRQGACGPEGCYKEPAASKASEAEAKWKQAVIEAGQLAGNAPGAWQELVKAAMPKPPFTLKLFEYLNRGLGGDTSWDALNRRHIHAGLYLPCDTKQVMGDVLVAVDTSGSMSTEQLRTALGYIRSFRDQHPCRLHLVQCDYGVPERAGYKVYEEFETLPETFEVHGRGGTSFDPPFKLMREKRLEPKVAIYLTDGYGTCTEKKPPCDVLWVVLQGDRTFKPPFGELVFV